MEWDRTGQMGRDGMGWNRETESEGQRQVRGLMPEDGHSGAVGTSPGTVGHGEEPAVYYPS